VPDTPSLYGAPANQITYDLVRDFVLEVEQTNLLSETLTLEFKKQQGDNAAYAVASFANSDGGLVLVGVSKKLEGEARFVGITSKERDSLINHLQSVMPDAVSEEIPVRIPNTDRLIAILRVERMQSFTR
jgi:predicted HTH transcriptional regulator